MRQVPVSFWNGLTVRPQAVKTIQDGYLFSQLSQQQQHQQQHQQQQQQQQQQQLLLLLLLLLILLQLLLLLLLLLKRQVQQSLEHQLQELSPQRQHIEDKEGTHLKPQHQINVLDK
jgi:flagellar biosynthesis/type III secretory pathway M-ring protein FliF/YscJ